MEPIHYYQCLQWQLLTDSLHLERAVHVVLGARVSNILTMFHRTPFHTIVELYIVV